MKILYVSSALIPSRTANSINIVKSCHAMAALGHQVTLLAPNIRSQEIEAGVGDPFAHYGVKRNFSLQTLPCPAMPGGRSLYCLLASRFAARFNPDLVFGRYLRATYQVCRLGFPTVLELHSAIRFKGQKSRYFEKLLERPNLLALITLTEEMADHFRALPMVTKVDKPVLVAGCGGDPPAATLASVELPSVTSGYQVGFAGKLHQVKGMGLISELAQHAAGHDFQIFGGSAEEVSAWQRNDPAPNLHFHGFIPPGELPPRLAALDICLLPSQRNPINPGQKIYGSPLKLFEYMACGKAILASDLPELHEVLDSRTAVFLDPEDPAAWAQAIDSLDRRQLDSLGSAAQAKFLRQFTREARYRRLLEQIGESLGGTL